MSDNTDLMTSLLDTSLDDLVDLPEFLVYPPGAYKVMMEMSTKAVNDHPSIEVKFKLLEVLEVPDPTTAPEIGAESSVLFQLDNDFGQGKFKEFQKPLKENTGATTLGQLVELTKGMELTIVTGQRKDKKDPDKVYMEVKKIII